MYHASLYFVGCFFPPFLNTVILRLSSSSGGGSYHERQRPCASGVATGDSVPTGYTAVTVDLYYSGGYLGTLSAPAIGLSVKVYQGTDSDALRKGAGHFENTSIWDGNAVFAGHNRGVNNNFVKFTRWKPATPSS